MLVRLCIGPMSRFCHQLRLVTIKITNCAVVLNLALTLLAVSFTSSRKRGSVMSHQQPQDGANPNAAEMRRWVVAASRWGQATQSVVGAAADLALASRTLADAIEISDARRVLPLDPPSALSAELRVLSDEVEADTRELRDRFLSTEANLAEYRQVVG